MLHSDTRIEVDLTYLFDDGELYVESSSQATLNNHGCGPYSPFRHPYTCTRKYSINPWDPGVHAHHTVTFTFKATLLGLEPSELGAQPKFTIMTGIVLMRQLLRHG